jgi:hypothetical protein
MVGAWKVVIGCVFQMKISEPLSPVYQIVMITKEGGKTFVNS